MTLRGFTNSSSAPPLPSFSERDNPDSRLPCEPPKPRSLRRCAAVPARAGQFRRICGRLGSGATPIVSPASRCGRPPPEPGGPVVWPWPPSQIVVEPKPSAAKLFLEDSILFAKVVDGELLLLVHPSGHGDQQELEWVEDSLRLQNPLSRAQSRNASGQALSIRSEFWTLRDHPPSGSNPADGAALSGR